MLSYERNAYTRNTFLNGNNITVRNRLANMLARQPPLEKEQIVWRGQASNTIVSDSWMSASTHMHIALLYGGAYLFKIHLEPGVRCLDMYSYYAQHNIMNPANTKESMAIRNFLGKPNLNMSHNYTQFGEILVQGGGTFWMNARHTKAGFKVIGRIRSRVPRANLPPPAENGQVLQLSETDYPIIPIFETWYSMERAKELGYVGRCSIA